MATTTNYSWTTPDDTDLVKDGASAIRSLGSAIDSTVFTNAGNAVQKSTIDAKGDLLVGTADNTITRLAVGTNNYVLTADSAEASGVKWASPAGGGDFTKISATTFSAVASHSVDNCFSATYKYYLVIFDYTSTATNAEMIFRLRASGTDTSVNYTSVWSGGGGPSAFSEQNALGTDEVKFNTLNGTDRFASNIIFYNPNVASSTSFTGTSTGTYASNKYSSIIGGCQTDSTQFDGLTIYPASGNITGSIKVYGYAN